MQAYLKKLVLNHCPSAVQRQLRRAYLSRSVAHGVTSREREIDMVRQLVRPGDQVADIGANVGLYTKTMSDLVGEQGRVYAFEPISGNYEILTEMIRRGNLKNVQTYRVALGAVHSDRTMVVPDTGDFNGYYQAHFVIDDSERGEREQVEILSLDELCERKEIPTLDFIKCDVEGSELDVLEGAISLLRTQTPGVLIEVARKASEQCFSLFKELGYHGFVYENKLRPTESYLDKQFSNYFFVHPQSRIWARAALDEEALLPG